MKHPNQEQMIQMIEAGKTVSDIRKVLKCGRTTVYTWMRRLGVEPPSMPRPTGWKKRDWLAIQQAYDQGSSRQDCLERFDLRPEAWGRAANEGRLVLRPEDRPSVNEDLVGQIFDDWTILQRVESPVNPDGNRYWLCQCGCGVKVIKTTTQVKFDSKSCGCRKKRKGSNAPMWRGYGEISLSYWGSVMRASKSRCRGSRVIPFEITIEEGWSLFLEQSRKCAISGVDLMFGPHSCRSSTTASLDRIDSSKGYVKGNVQWVHKDVNVMKLDHSSIDFLKWIDTIYHHQHPASSS